MCVPPFSTCWRSSTIVTPCCFKLFWGNWLIQSVDFLYQKTGGISLHSLPNANDILQKKKKQQDWKMDQIYLKIVFCCLALFVELLTWRWETSVVLQAVCPLWTEQWIIVAVTGLQDDFLNSTFYYFSCISIYLASHLNFFLYLELLAMPRGYCNIWSGGDVLSISGVPRYWHVTVHAVH